MSYVDMLRAPKKRWPEILVELGGLLKMCTAEGIGWR